MGGKAREEASGIKKGDVEYNHIQAISTIGGGLGNIRVGGLGREGLWGKSGGILKRGRRALRVPLGPLWIADRLG